YWLSIGDTLIDGEHRALAWRVVRGKIDELALVSLTPRVDLIADLRIESERWPHCATAIIEAEPILLEAIADYPYTRSYHHIIDGLVELAGKHDAVAKSCELDKIATVLRNWQTKNNTHDFSN
ncbi:MAG: hypothetical protein ACK4SY_10700, partial [Pyrobaculum sp.]